MRMGTAATSWMLGAVLGLTVFMPLYFQVVHKLSADRGRPRAHPDRGDDDARIDAVRPLDDVSAPLQSVGDREAIIAIASVAALVAWPAMPLYGVVIALTLIGFGAGTVYPVATVSIQNAVPMHQVGTATGAMNFSSD